ncbi:electron transfer flavoprotein subunit beta/FixA family protein [[Eubacterium] cellulosolvens]
MKIVVCVKQVPDTTEVKVDEKTGTLIREGVPSIINPFDQFAMEEGVRLKELLAEGDEKPELIALSMGPPQARTEVMKCLALGADRGILLTDRQFAGADTWVTALTLSLAIRQLEDVKLVLCGLQAIDGDTGQVGPELAQCLRMPQITYVEKTAVEEKKIVAHRQTGEGYAVIESRLPVLLTLVTPSDFVPTNPPFSKIMKAKKKPYEEWNISNIKGDPDKLGLNGSPTQVKRVFPPPRQEKGVIIDGEPSEQVKQLVEYLMKDHLV